TTNRMAKAATTAVDVGDGTVQAEPHFACDILRGESFVDLNELDVLEGHPGLLERFPSGRHRPVTHEMRFHAGGRMRHDPSHGGEPQFPGLAPRHDDCGG